MTAFQEFKLAVVTSTGLSKDALHIYFGLTALFVVALALRKPLRSVIPWSIVLLGAVVFEFADMRDDINSLGRWRWAASAHDIINTMLWPTVLLFLARSRTLFGV